MPSEESVRLGAALALIPLLVLAILQLSTGVAFAACPDEEAKACTREWLACDDTCEECEEAYQDCIEACGGTPGEGQQCL